MTDKEILKSALDQINIKYEETEKSIEILKNQEKVNININIVIFYFDGNNNLEEFLAEE